MDTLTRLLRRFSTFSGPTRHTMTPETLHKLVPPLIALQFLGFGWRVNQEIRVGRAERQTVIPLPDVLNIMSLFATVGCTVILPLATETHLWLSHMVVSGAYILIVFYPFTVATHYELWKRKSTSRKATEEANDRYATARSLLSRSFALSWRPWSQPTLESIERRCVPELGR